MSMTPVLIVLVGLSLIALAYLFFPRRLTITRVVDGDSLEAIYRGRSARIRLAGYDAPEYRQPAGFEARAALVEITKANTLRILLPRRDRYGRLLGTSFAGILPVSWRMVLAGYGWPEGKIGLILSLLPRIARRGLWRHPKPVHPSFWRAINQSQHPADI